MPDRTLRVLALSIVIEVAIASSCAWCASHPVPASVVPERADRIVVTKSSHTLVLYSHGAVLRTYKVALGRASGAKEQQGDNRTPEGHYRIDAHNPHSTCHRSLHISYPNSSDHARASAAHYATGGDIMIHGLPNGFGYIGAAHRLTDWTFGCIAVTDAEVEEIYRLVPDGTPIDILP